MHGTLSLLYIKVFRRKKQKQNIDFPIGRGTLTYTIDTESC